MTALRDKLFALRAHRGENLEVRGATEALTTVKHQLREWIETQLPSLNPHHDRVAFARELNQKLRQAQLFDGPPIAAADVDGERLLGLLDEVEIGYLGLFLTIKTRVRRATPLAVRATRRRTHPAERSGSCRWEDLPAWCARSRGIA